MKKSQAVCMLLGLALPAVAGEPVTTITQVNKTFSSLALAIKVGETIRFSNADTVTHNLFLKAEGIALNALQEPGNEVDVVFPNAGKYTVRCAIHPQMTFAVTVE
ncbi:MAG: methylamine utilization protein [Myxococcales bacterium]|nr:methylamine utilization protein [Myxococcales bacterium]